MFSQGESAYSTTPQRGSGHYTGHLGGRTVTSMSRIKINKVFTMPRETLRGELDRLIDELSQQLQLNCEWLSDYCLDFRRSGITGQISIGDEELDLDIKLGILMNVFREPIEKEVLEFMDRHIY